MSQQQQVGALPDAFWPKVVAASIVSSAGWQRTGSATESGTGELYGYERCVSVT